MALKPSNRYPREISDHCWRIIDKNEDMFEEFLSEVGRWFYGKSFRLERWNEKTWEVRSRKPVSLLARLEVSGPLGSYYAPDFPDSEGYWLQLDFLTNDLNKNLDDQQDVIREFCSSLSERADTPVCCWIPQMRVFIGRKTKRVGS